MCCFKKEMSINDLNRFFKLWIKGSNPRLKDLSIYLPTEIIPNCLAERIKINRNKGRRSKQVHNQKCSWD
ncbi:hypothetical protein L5515_012513 [Caenorhabditis briggsae]|uniref:Sdz-33 F-box domain-containing protein n=1 Tax=Caenorhabditis briggsae TaxID=6238 RepID=A0AAE9JGE6_CAEBR|nr:hypothetical protein L5515_012513 [Caenorhabditis briggsae]